MDALSLLVGALAGLAVGAALWLRERDARVRAEAQQAVLATAEQRLGEAFKAAASDALNGNSQRLLELAQQSLGQKETAIEGLVKPLQEALKQYEQHLSTMEADRRRQAGALDEQLKALAQANERLQR
jgi:DNA recombination protein RmuC